MRVLLALCLLAGTAQAESLMTVEEFEAWSTGKTLDYAVDGQVYGSESYFPGRKTLDADTGGPCRAGSWFPKDDRICFVYEGASTEHCWRFWRDGDRVLADFLGQDPDAPISEVTEAATPLACPGPDVGV